MYSQIDIRYSVSPDINTIRGLVNAFPGNITLCLENKMLYQYCEYPVGIQLPADNGATVLATTDDTLRSRWISIDMFSAKSLTGSFTVSDWELDQSGEKYTYTILFPNKLQSTNIEVIDVNGVVVYPELVTYSINSGLTAATLTISAIPDCRFSGNYSIFFDKVV